MSVSGKRVAGDGGGGRGGGIDPSALWPVVLLEDQITHALTSAFKHFAGSWHTSSTSNTSISLPPSNCHHSSHPSSNGGPKNTKHLLPIAHSPIRRTTTTTSTVTQTNDTITSCDDANSTDLLEYSLRQVAEHSTPLDCWIVIYDKIYDVTDFLQEHPGGEFILLEFAGRDATLAFRSTRHGSESYELLNKYLIGILPKSERIYKNRESPNSTFDSDPEPNPSC